MSIARIITNEGFYCVENLIKKQYYSNKNAVKYLFTPLKWYVDGPFDRQNACQSIYNSRDNLPSV